MKSTLNKPALVLCIFYVLFAFINAKAQTGDVPRIISYQGQIASTEGKPMDGLHHIVVSLYSDRFGKASVWQGIYDAELKNGLFSLLLGSGKYILPQSADLDKSLWVGIKIDEGEELKPLTQLATVPYALNVPNKSITAEKLSDEVRLSMSSGRTPTVQAAAAWEVIGNSVSGGLLGTTSNNDWNLITNGQRTVAYQKGTVIDTLIDIVAGFKKNSITDGSYGSNVIAGGGFEITYLSANQIHKSDIAVIGGGANNKIGDTISGVGHPVTYRSQVIAGGSKNKAWQDYTTVGGGHCNWAFAMYSSILGGNMNWILDTSNFDHGQYSIIGGGDMNMIESDRSAIFGGSNNMLGLNSHHSFIGGGDHNMIDSQYSVISGGDHNATLGQLSAIAGGNYLTLGDRSFGFSGQRSSTSTDLSGKHGVAAFVDVDVLIGNVNSTSRELRFYAPSTDASLNGAFTSFKAQTQNPATPFIYTLPDTIGKKGAILFVNDLTTSSGTTRAATLSWIQPGSSGQVLKMKSSGLPGWAKADTGSGGGNVLVWYDEDPNHSPAAGQGPLARGYAAIAHGENDSTQGDFGTIGGGEHNLIDSFARHSVIAGGGFNIIPRRLNHTIIGGEDTLHITDSIEYSFIGGGHANTLRAPYGVIGGGESNLIDSNWRYGASYSVIGGGYKNKIDVESPYNVIAGGGYNYHAGYLSFIGGGSRDTIFSNCGWDAIAGGYQNYIGNQNHTFVHPKSISYSFIGGGDTNTVASSFSGILSGRMDAIADNSDYSSISGGDSNSIAANSAYSFIGSGVSNTVAAGWSSVVGGKWDIIGDSADYSFIGGGINNVVKAKFSVISGGDTNEIRKNIFGHGSSDHSVIAGGHSNFIDTLDKFGGAFPSTYVLPSYVTISGGRDNCVSGHYAALGGGWHNKISGSYSCIPGGMFLNADDYQTVIGRCNLPSTLGIPNNWGSFNKLPNNSTSGQHLPLGDYWTFMIGNGTVDSTYSSLIHGSNAFMVSDNGHSIVSDTGGSGGASKPSGRSQFMGGTYIDNVIDAWAIVEWKQASANIHAPDSVTVRADHGCQYVKAIAAKGVYEVKLNLKDPLTDSIYTMKNASVTATLMDFGSELSGCCIISVTPISNNIFTVKINDVACLAMDHSFTFHVTGR